MRPDTSTTELRAVTDLLESALAAMPATILQTGILAAVSAGPDSTALALALAELRRRARDRSPRLDFVIAHVDHGVRDDSARDATATRELADALGVRFVAHRLPPFPKARPGEAELRAARYAALLEIAERLGMGAVATGHHADDVIETFVFRAQRGTGLRGLAAIPHVRALSPRVALVRPLLGARRTELAAVCRAAGRRPSVDPTNADQSRARNHLRHAVLPAWRASHGAALFDATVLACVTDAQRAIAALDREVAEWTRGAISAHGDARLLTATGRWPDRAIVTGALRLVHLELRGVAPTRDWLARAAALLDAPTGRRLAGRGATLCVRRVRAGLWIGDERAIRDDLPRSVATGPRALHTHARAVSDPPAAHEVP